MNQSAESASPSSNWPSRSSSAHSGQTSIAAVISFTFLGYALRPRGARSKTGERFTGFLPAISPEALKAKSVELRRMRIHRRTDLTLNDLAAWLKPILAGWMRYYGRFYRSALTPLLRRVSFLPEALGWEEIQAAAHAQAVPTVVGRAPATRARPVCPLGVGALVLTAGEKSPVTGDRHAGIRRSRGLRRPRPPDPE
jgi:hypothetical protein